MDQHIKQKGIVLKSVLYVFIIGMFSIGVSAFAEPVQFNCHMNQCVWADFQSKEKIDTGNDGGVLYKTVVTYGTSDHPDVGRVDGVDYPLSFSSNLNVDWGQPTEQMVYCSSTKPTVFTEGQPIKTFSFPMVFGYEVSAAQLYVLACHGTNQWATEELLRNFGYTNVQSQEFNSVDGLLGKSGSQFQSSKDVFYRVVGVASDDVLNIRSQPTSKSEIIGAFAYNEPLVEITGRDGNWVRVNSGERSGWAHSGYLEQINLPVFSNTNLPNSLKCYGEEPFWNVTLRDSQIQFESPSHGNSNFVVSSIEAKGNDYMIHGMNQSGGQIEIYVRDEIASSSMVERYYNWSVSLKLDGSAIAGGTGCSM